MSIKKKSYRTCPICGSDCTEVNDWMEHIHCEQQIECVHGHWGYDWAYGNSIEWFRLPNSYYEEVGWTYTDRNVKIPHAKWKKRYKKFLSKNSRKWDRRKINVECGDYIFKSEW